MHVLKVFYRPDNYPHWLPWKEFQQKFSTIGKPGSLDAGCVPSARANFAPRQSLGKPHNACDPSSTNRSLRRGYEFQVKFQGSGHVVIDRFRIHAQRLYERSTAKTT